MPEDEEGLFVKKRRTENQEMRIKKTKEPSDPIVDVLIWIYQLVGQIFQLAKAIILRKTVDFLKSLNDLFPGEFTYDLFESYGNWYNGRLIRNALDYENNTPKHFKVTVEDVQTINNYLVITVKYEDMTEKNIRMYIPNRLAMEISANRKAIQIHRVDKNRVKAIVDISA